MGLTFHRVELELLVPFRTTHGEVRTRDVVLVALAADGGTGGAGGWGECPTLPVPGYQPVTTADVWDALVHDRPWPEVLAGAVRDAALDAEARSTGRSAAEHLAGGEVPAVVATTAVVGVAPSIDELVARVGSEVAAGARHVKLKVTPSWCAEPLAAVHVTWPDLDLAVDANGSFEAADLRVLADLAALGVRYVEQPMAPGPWRSEHGRWPTAAPAVALDESVSGTADVDWLLDHPAAATLVNIKGARLGGLAAALSTARRLHDLGIGCFVGGMLETGVGRAGALALAAAVAALGAPEPTDVGPSRRYFADDVTAPLHEAEPGVMAVPLGPGIGRTPRPDRLAAVTIATLDRPAPPPERPA